MASRTRSLAAMLFLLMVTHGRRQLATEPEPADAQSVRSRAIHQPGRRLRAGQPVGGDLGSGRSAVDHRADGIPRDPGEPGHGSRRIALTLDDAYQTSVQDGLMGLALHPDLLQGRGRDFVYLAYTYDADPGRGITRRLRVRRYTYDATAADAGCPGGRPRQPAGARRPRRRTAADRARRQAVPVAGRPGRQLARATSATRSAPRTCPAPPTSPPATGRPTRGRSCAWSSTARFPPTTRPSTACAATSTATDSATPKACRSARPGCSMRPNTARAPTTRSISSRPARTTAGR